MVVPKGYKETVRCAAQKTGESINGYIKIVSPGSRRMDYFTKVFKYRTAGVREYWIVDPEKNRITIWNFEKDDNNEYSFADSVEPGIYPGFYIDFHKLDI